MSSTHFDWSDLAFSSKKALRSLDATFIAAPREMSTVRILQLIREYLPKGNVVFGISKEPFVADFEDQPQFRMLPSEAVQPVADKVAASSSANKIYTLSYFQRETDYILEKVKFRRVVLVRGSWHLAFHNRNTYYLLANNRIDYELVSPFADEAEARHYDSHHWPEMLQAADMPAYGDSAYSEQAMLRLAAKAADLSYDYSFQTGVSLGRKQRGRTYGLLAWSFNRVVPYQTYALHHGTSREVNFSPPNDLNHYDTVHAEVELVIKAQKEQIDLTGTTLFINLLPCPPCARMLSETDIDELVYSKDHSNGYAIRILELAGKKVRRVVTT